MKQKRWFLGLYLIIAVIFGFFGLVDNILAYFAIAPNYALYYSAAIAVFSFVFFFFNIFSIAVFRHHNVEKIAYVLPAYYLICYVMFFIISFTLAEITVNWVTNTLMGASALTSLFEMGFGLYLLKRLRYQNENKSF